MNEILSTYCIGFLDVCNRHCSAKLQENLGASVGENTKYIWWGMFIAESEQPLKLATYPFFIVDNVDEQGKVYLIKDVRFVKPMLVHELNTELQESDAENQCFFAGTLEDSEKIRTSIAELKEFSSTVELVCNTVPLKILKICTNEIF